MYKRQALCDAGYDVSLETSGALDIASVDPRVSRVVDLKAPGSGESGKNRWQNLEQLTPRDELKFVLKDRSDYEWARHTVFERRLDALCPLLFSPVQELSLIHILPPGRTALRLKRVAAACPR